MRQMPDRRSRSDRDRRCTGFGASTVSCPSCIPPDMNSLAEEMEDRYCGELSSASTVLEGPAFAGRKKLPEKDFPVSRLPATLSLHVKRSPQQVINSPDSLNSGLLAANGPISRLAYRFRREPFESPARQIIRINPARRSGSQWCRAERGPFSVSRLCEANLPAFPIRVQMNPSTGPAKD